MFKQSLIVHSKIAVIFLFFYFSSKITPCHNNDYFSEQIYHWSKRLASYQVFQCKNKLFNLSYSYQKCVRLQKTSKTHCDFWKPSNVISLRLNYQSNSRVWSEHPITSRPIPGKKFTALKFLCTPPFFLYKYTG